MWRNRWHIVVYCTCAAILSLVLYSALYVLGDLTVRPYESVLRVQTDPPVQTPTSTTIVFQVDGEELSLLHLSSRDGGVPRGPNAPISESQTITRWRDFLDDLVPGSKRPLLLSIECNTSAITVVNDADGRMLYSYPAPAGTYFRLDSWAANDEASAAVAVQLITVSAVLRGTQTTTTRESIAVIGRGKGVRPN
jgi:hypothetical protein